VIGCFRLIVFWCAKLIWQVITKWHKIAFFCQGLLKVILYLKFFTTLTKVGLELAYIIIFELNTRYSGLITFLQTARHEFNTKLTS